MYDVILNKRAQKDHEKLIAAKLGKKAKALIDLMKENPFINPPPYEKLVGDLKGCYSRRINATHRMVYTVHPKENKVVIRSMWSHYA